MTVNSIAEYRAAVFELLASKNQALRDGWHATAALDHGLHVVDEGVRLHIENLGLAVQHFDEDLHARPAMAEREDDHGTGEGRSLRERSGFDTLGFDTFANNFSRYLTAEVSTINASD